MNYTITTTLSAPIYHFLKEEGAKNKRSRKSVLEEALTLYRKEKLAEEVKKGLLARNEEYSASAQDFSEIQAASVQE